MWINHGLWREEVKRGGRGYSAEPPATRSRRRPGPPRSAERGRTEDARPARHAAPAATRRRTSTTTIAWGRQQQGEQPLPPDLVRLVRPPGADDDGQEGGDQQGETDQAVTCRPVPTRSHVRPRCRWCRWARACAAAYRALSRVQRRRCAESRAPRIVGAMPCRSQLFAWLTFGGLLWSAGLSPGGEGGEAGGVDFQRDIRPLLSDRCFVCHGPDEGARQAGLRLDTFAGATAKRDGGAAVVPGDPAASLLLQRVTTHDADARMPPPASKLELDPGEIELFTRWIEEGAAYARTLGLRPAGGVGAARGGRLGAGSARRLRAPCPERGRPRARGGGRPRHLAAPGELRPHRAPPHPRGARRLPRGPRRRRARAGRRSPAGIPTLRGTHGERLARHGALRRHPRLPGRRLSRGLALARLGSSRPSTRTSPGTTSRRGSSPETSCPRRRAGSGWPPHSTACTARPTRAAAWRRSIASSTVSDRVHTMGTAFLGLTLECARCHDHKFDPIAQTEYYELSAFFDNIDESGLYSHFTSATPTPALALPDADQERALELAPGAGRGRRAGRERGRVRRPASGRTPSAGRGPGRARLVRLRIAHRGHAAQRGERRAPGQDARRSGARARSAGTRARAGRRGQRELPRPRRVRAHRPVHAGTAAVDPGGDARAPAHGRAAPLAGLDRRGQPGVRAAPRARAPVRGVDPLLSGETRSACATESRCPRRPGRTSSCATTARRVRAGSSSSSTESRDPWRSCATGLTRRITGGGDLALTLGQRFRDRGFRGGPGRRPARVRSSALPARGRARRRPGAAGGARGSLRDRPTRVLPRRRRRAPACGARGAAHGPRGAGRAPGRHAADHDHARAFHSRAPRAS